MNQDSKTYKIEALRAKANSFKSEAIATLDTYLNNSVGIGEHPQFIDEAFNQVIKIADAESYLEVIEKLKNNEY